MSKNIGTLTPGTEYQESLSRFLSQEAKSGHISLSGMRRVSMKRNIAGLAALLAGMAMVSTGAGFISTGGTQPLFMLVGTAATVVTAMTVLARSPGGLFYQVAEIDSAFTHASLLRFVACGAPDDVTRELITLLNTQGRVSYAQVHDVVWFCSRQASGIGESHLFHDRYALIRSRLELKTRRAG